MKLLEFKNTNISCTAFDKTHQLMESPLCSRNYATSVFEDYNLAEKAAVSETELPTAKNPTEVKALANPSNPEISAKLAKTAERMALITNTWGNCYKAVKAVLKKMGLSKGDEIKGKYAYEAIKSIGNHENFQKLDPMPEKELKKLPAGHIIVWESGPKSKEGHIGISLGNGKEASDHVQNISARQTKYHVFAPVSPDK